MCATCLYEPATGPEILDLSTPPLEDLDFFGFSAFAMV
jgi:hypothetical protein